MPFESQTSLSRTSHKGTFFISCDRFLFACEFKNTLDNNSGEQDNCGEADIEAGGLWVSWWWSITVLTKAICQRNSNYSPHILKLNMWKITCSPVLLDSLVEHSLIFKQWFMMICTSTCWKWRILTLFHYLVFSLSYNFIILSNNADSRWDQMKVRKAKGKRPMSPVALLLAVNAYFYRTRVWSLASLVSDFLTHSSSVTLSRLDWCYPSVWRCQLKTCWECYCSWCLWWRSCWQQFVAGLEVEVWS